MPAVRCTHKSCCCADDEESGRKWPGGDNGHTKGKELGIGKYPHLWDTTKCYAPPKK